MRIHHVIKTCTLLLVVCTFSSCTIFRSTHDPEFDVQVEQLAQEILSQPRNHDLAELAAERIASIDESPQAEINRRLDALDITPVRVPGLMYKKYPRGGADLVIMSRLLQRELPLIPLNESGTVEENAAILADYVREATKDGGRVALLSASKGSADAYTALLNNPDLGPRVAFWIDVVGLLEGTPLTNEDAPSMQNPRSSIPRETLHSFSSEVMKPKSKPDNFPHETIALHVIAFPLSAEITRAGRHRFSELKTLGPNDGYALLDTYTRTPGRVYLVRGADHYLKIGKSTAVKMLALLQILLDELEEKESRASANSMTQ